MSIWTAIAAQFNAVRSELAAGLATKANTSALPGAATTAASGLVELATTGETTTGADTTRAVTPAGVKAAVDALVAGAPGALDTLKEISDQLAADESAVGALTTTVAGKASKSANLSDLADAASARSNLGLGNVNNTSDASKPVSTATATALSGKADLTGGVVSDAQLPARLTSASITSLINAAIYGSPYGSIGAMGSTPVDLTGTATYYVDSVNGVDANNGTSAATPKKTIAALPTLVAGNTVALKCGSEFREAIPFAASGTSGSRITWGQYGTGTMPKVKGSKDYGTSLVWTSVGSGIYSAPAASLLTTSNVLYVDELTPLRKMASQAAITASGQYFADTTNNVLYVRMWDDSNPTGRRIEQNGNVSTVANMGTRGYTTVQDIAVMHGHGNLSGILAAGTQAGIIVRRCMVAGHFGTGLYVGTPGMIAEDNLVSDCWDAVPYPSSNGNSVGINYGNGANGIGAQIRRNRVRRAYYGIRCNTSVLGGQIHHNLIEFSQLNGLDNNGGAGTAAQPIEFYNNTIIHRPNTPNGHGLDQQVGDGMKSRNNLVYTDYTGASTNVQLLDLSSGTGANTSEDYNLAYAAPGSSAQFGKVGTTQYADKTSYVAAVTASYGAGNNTVLINADPLFVDFAGGDYRLKIGSPARNAGTVIAGVTDGYLGSAPDIGCYEMAG